MSSLLGDLKGSIDDQNKSNKFESSEIDPYINRGIAEEALGYGQKRKKIIYLLFLVMIKISSIIQSG